ncbi:hypothetical protein SK128_025463 [Halocaridina rubra]|uniref:Methyltransferase domain-containing protein n=1 Tax=Halocaridina rubra TaxID=373956 RepID=A0AAN8X8I4_HALRR
MLYEARKQVVYVVFVFSLLAYAVFVTLLLYRNNHQSQVVSVIRPPYIPSGLVELFDYITKTSRNCHNPLTVPGTEYREGENRSISGHEGTFICLDGVPDTPEACRIYSFGFNRDDIKFETTMGKRGCRVHLVSGTTEYSYSTVGKNVYLYPLNLSNSTGLGEYTLDNFINLMNHMEEPIQYIKTTTMGTEWTLLHNLFTSKYNAFHHVKQIRLLLHLPLANDDNIEILQQQYRLLLGLEYYGYSLLYSRPINGTFYFHYNLDRDVATKYETVWVRH